MHRIREKPIRHFNLIKYYRTNATSSTSTRQVQKEKESGSGLRKVAQWKQQYLLRIALSWAKQNTLLGSLHD